MVETKLFAWVQKQLQKWYKIVKLDQATNFDSLYPRKELTKAFKLLLEEVQGNLQNIQADQQSDTFISQINKYYKLEYDTLGEQYMKKNKRIQRDKVNLSRSYISKRDYFGDKRTESAYSFQQSESDDNFDYEAEKEYFKGLKRQDKLFGEESLYEL